MNQAEQESQRQELESLREQLKQQDEVNAEKQREQFRREYNITTAEPIDVSALYYQHLAARGEIERLTLQIQKLEKSMDSARQHIEGEPQRIAAAVEAARTPIHNIVESATKR